MIPLLMLSSAAESGSYLPLDVGKRWVLRSSKVERPVVFTVSSAHGDAHSLDFDNPWVPSTLELRGVGGRVAVTAVTMSGNRTQLPAETIYWDFNAPEKDSWHNAIGTMTVISRNKTVNSPAGRFEHCIEIHEKSNSGSDNYWVFAPGVGFVQFGEGAGAFLLESYPQTSTGPFKAKGEPSLTANAALPKIGLSLNLLAGESGNGAIEAHFLQARQAGVSIVYISPKWNEIETAAHVFSFASVDGDVDRAVRSQLPVVCDFRVIDTNRRSMPADLQNRNFDDAEMRTRLLAALDALVPHLRGRAQWVMIGNEIDPYFREHRKEIAAYSRLFAEGSRHLKQLAPGVLVSATVTAGGLDEIGGALRPIYEQSDFIGLTYYPLNADFTMRAPETVNSDFDRMIAAARGKPILLQEVGYPSSPNNDSSDERQAQFIQAVFDNLRSHRSSLIAANFFLMSDFSDDWVNMFSKYYKSNNDRFKSYLKTLGMFDDHGRAKPSWEVFTRNLREFHG
jgi:hypothetical protein